MNTFLPWLEHNHGKIDALLIDIDGTLLIAGKPAPGAAALLNYLDSNEIPCLLTTNDCVHSQMEKAAILAQAGLHVPPDRIVSCGCLIARQLRLSHVKKLAVAGMIHPDYYSSAEMVLPEDADETVNAVLVNRGMHNFESDIAMIVNLLRKNPLAELIFANSDLLRVTGSFAGFFPSCGLYKSVLLSIMSELALTNPCFTAGKPDPAFWKYCEDKLGCMTQRNKILSIGDTFQTDAAGAIDYGFQGVCLTSARHESVPCFSALARE